MLSADWAREKTTCLFAGRDKQIFNPANAQCLGRKIGAVLSRSGSKYTVESSEELTAGDRLRLADPSADKTKSLKLQEFTKEGNTYTFSLASTEFVKGDLLFKAGDSLWDERGMEKEVDVMYDRFKASKVPAIPKTFPVRPGYTDLITRQWMDKTARISALEVPRVKKESRMPDARARKSKHALKHIQEPAFKTFEEKTGEEMARLQSPRKEEPSQPEISTLWVKIDDPQWTGLMPSGQKIIFSLKKENIHAFKELAQETDPSTLACELTPYISQRELGDYKQHIDFFIASGIKKWVLNNVSQGEFFKGTETERYSGQFLYVWNAYSARVLKDMGISRYTVSWEDDILNITRMANAGLRGRLMVYLFGYPPVARSRMLDSELFENGLASDNTGESFRIEYESGSAVVLPSTPLSLFTARERLLKLQVTNFGIDLSHIKPHKNSWNMIYDAYREMKNLPNSIKFNFKAGVK
jgi:hypothetical protein